MCDYTTPIRSIHNHAASALALANTMNLRCDVSDLTKIEDHLQTILSIALAIMEDDHG